MPAENISQPIKSIPEASNIKVSQALHQKPYQPFQAPTIPLQSTTAPVQSTTLGGDSKNLQYVQQKYGQTQYQSGNMGGQSSTLGNLQGETGLNRKRSVSSSSSSSDRNKRVSLNANMNQPLYGQSSWGQPGNIQTGYGPTTGYDSMYTGNAVGTMGYGQNMMSSDAVLGKNLYG